MLEHTKAASFLLDVVENTKLKTEDKEPLWLMVGIVIKTYNYFIPH